MAIKYSPSAGGFFDTEIHGDAIPTDAMDVTAERHKVLLAAQASGKRIGPSPSGAPDAFDPPPATPSQIAAMYEAALDAHLDGVARSHRYRDRFTFALRAGYPGPYHDEGVRFATWMDECNAQAYALFESVTINGAVPPTVDEFIASLPAFL